MSDTIPCPQRGAPAWITERFRFGSTDGSVEHLKTGCVNNHWLTPLAANGRPGAACRPGSRPASTPVGDLGAADPDRRPSQLASGTALRGGNLLA
jgi:hypothetical protein